MAEISVGRPTEAKIADLLARYGRTDVFYLPSAGQAVQDVRELLQERTALIAEIAGLRNELDIKNALIGQPAPDIRTVTSTSMPGQGLPHHLPDAPSMAFILLNGAVHDTQNRGGAPAPDYIVHARNVLLWKTVDGNPPGESEGKA